MRRHLHLVAACAALLSVHAPDAGASGNDAEIAAAARAIFGDGLSVTRSGDKITVDWGTLTEEKARYFLETYWGPALDSIDPYTVFSVDDKRWVFPFYTKSLRKTSRAYFLMEPDGRRELCLQIARVIGDARLAQATRDFCTVRAVETANRGVIGFRGKKASYNTTAPWAGIWFKERLWQNKNGVRDLLLVTSGPVDIDQYEQLKYIAHVADIGRTAADQYSLDARRKLRRLRDAAADKLAKKDALTDARDARQVGDKAAVIFTDHPASGWRKMWPLKGSEKVSCYETHVHTYSPAKAWPGQLYTLTVALNGRTCSSKRVGFNDQRVREHASLWDYCTGRDRYDSGANRVEVTLAKDVIQRQGRTSDRGKGDVVARKTFTCRAR